MLKPAAMLISLTIFAGCATQPADAGDRTGCPIYETRDWKALLTSSTDGQTAFTLSVTGVADLPNPAYNVSWAPGPMDRRNPPALVLNIVAVPSGEVAAQVIDTRTIAYELPIGVPALREVRIVCVDRVLAIISDVF